MTVAELGHGDYYYTLVRATKCKRLGTTGLEPWQEWAMGQGGEPSGGTMLDKKWTEQQRILIAHEIKSRWNENMVTGWLSIDMETEKLKSMRVIESVDQETDDDQQNEVHNKMFELISWKSQNGWG